MIWTDKATHKGGRSLSRTKILPKFPVQHNLNYNMQKEKKKEIFKLLTRIRLSTN